MHTAKLPRDLVLPSPPSHQPLRSAMASALWRVESQGFGRKFYMTIDDSETRLEDPGIEEDRQRRPSKKRKPEASSP